MIDDVATLHAALDRVVRGQDEAKAGLLLGLLAGEHVYLEGPPGCGKGALAHALAHAAGLRAETLQFHRDLRASDLLGESVLRSAAREKGGARRLREERVAGALSHAELLVLEDPGRAPGEALGPLLRALGDRKFGARRLPLRCAIATALPTDAGGYSEPLEPSQLDRFAIQLRLFGLVAARRFTEARAILDMESASAAPASLSAGDLDRLQQRAAALPIAPEFPARLLELVGRLRADSGPAGSALLTDRAFGGQVVRVARAHALARGAERVSGADLAALRYMLACRVPEPVLRSFDTILGEVLDPPEVPTDSATGDPREGPIAGFGSGDAAGPGGGASSPPPAPHHADVTLEAPEPGEPGAAAEVDRLLAALSGRMQRGRVDRGEDPGGHPRRYRRLRRLDELFDADPLDAVLHLEGALPGGARVFARERRSRGGTIAILRDVSASMEGRLSRWAGEVVAGVARTAARRHMRTGYVEFNHAAERYTVGGRFFHRSYRRLFGLAGRRRAEGRTNYEAPLGLALDELRPSPDRNRHILLLTDGVPVVGDPQVRRARELARELGVRVHTVFLGLGACPPVLDAISLETGGVRFAARPGPTGKLRVRERRQRSPSPSQKLEQVR